MAFQNNYIQRHESIEVIVIVAFDLVIGEAVSKLMMLHPVRPLHHLRDIQPIAVLVTNTITVEGWKRLSGATGQICVNALH